MELYILDSDYQILGMIDEAESVLWNKRYNDAGEAEIYIPCSSEYLSMLRRGNYVYRYDDDMFCKISKVEIESDAENGDYIVATAPDIFNILAGRVVRWKVAYSGTVGEFIKKVLTDNAITPANGQTHRKIPKLTFDDRNIAEFSEKIETSAFADDLAQLVLTTCKAHNIGFRLSYDIREDKLVFRLYRGKNKASTTGGEYVEFSSAYSNIISSRYSEDDAQYKNVVYVGYKSANKDDETIYLYSYPSDEQEITGEKRREIYVDGSSTSRDITYDELVQMFGTVRKTTTTVTQDNKSVYSSVYYAIVSGAEHAVATSLQDVPESGNETEEKITVTDFTYLLLIRTLAANTLAESVMTQSFEGDVDTIDTYEYKTDYDLGDIVKVKNDYGIEAEAQITEVMESDDADNGYSIEPKFQYLN
jgi:hypothetical protein